MHSDLSSVKMASRIFYFLLSELKLQSTDKILPLRCTTTAPNNYNNYHSPQIKRENSRPSSVFNREEGALLKMRKVKYKEMLQDQLFSHCLNLTAGRQLLEFPTKLVNLKHSHVKAYSANDKLNISF